MIRIFIIIIVIFQRKFRRIIMRPNDDDIKIFHPRKAESSGEELAEDAEKSVHFYQSKNVRHGVILFGYVAEIVYHGKKESARGKTGTTDSTDWRGWSRRC
mgnify:CR=1 FL=1